MALTVSLPEGPELKSPTDFEDSPLSRAVKQPLMLGLFLNLQDINFSSLPTSNSWTFDYNAELVKRAEELGFEIAFSRTQWLPKGGYDGESSLDSFIALGAMAAVTKSILLISTIHVLYGPLHPLHLAKYGATLDHIARGRWGINIVTGHRAIEHEMFGWQRIDHDKRYDMAGELFDVLHRLWGETENFSYEGKLNPWAINNGWITPKPAFGRPPLVTATGSPAGIDFAARHSDLVFVTSPGGAHIDSALETLPDHIATIKNRARAYGRQVKTLINPIIVSRDTERQAIAYADAIEAGKTAARHPCLCDQQLRQRRPCLAGSRRCAPQAGAQSRRQYRNHRLAGAGGRAACRLEKGWHRWRAAEFLRFPRRSRIFR